MASYVDGFITPVPKRKLAAYRKLSRLSCKVWLEHGALQYVEAVADGIPWGKRTSFPRSVKQKAGETVMFAFVVYRSRRHRDQVNRKGMADPRLAAYHDLKKLPFDAKRMIWGGFKTVVEGKRRRR